MWFYLQYFIILFIIKMLLLNYYNCVCVLSVRLLTVIICISSAECLNKGESPAKSIILRAVCERVSNRLTSTEGMRTKATRSCSQTGSVVSLWAHTHTHTHTRACCDTANDRWLRDELKCSNWGINSRRRSHDVWITEQHTKASANVPRYQTGRQTNLSTETPKDKSRLKTIQMLRNTQNQSCRVLRIRDWLK